MLSAEQRHTCEENPAGYSDLKALFLNCTLKPTPQLSHTQGLIDISKAIMEKNGVAVEVLRPVDHDIAYGVYPDMREHGWDKDEWPDIYRKVQDAVILNEVKDLETKRFVSRGIASLRDSSLVPTCRDGSE